MPRKQIDDVKVRVATPDDVFQVMTMAETLNRRGQTTEHRSADAIEQVGGEVARIAQDMEARLGRAENVHAEALEKLGAEIGRISDRLALSHDLFERPWNGWQLVTSAFLHDPHSIGHILWNMVFLWLFGGGFGSPGYGFSGPLTTDASMMVVSLPHSKIAA